MRVSNTLTIELGVCVLQTVYFSLAITDIGDSFETQGEFYKDRYGIVAYLPLAS